jgi:hypothetical protein
MNRQCLCRILISAALAGFVLCTALAPDLRAQPVVDKIELKARPGEVIELSLRGKGLSDILRVDRVRVGGTDVKVLDHRIESDNLLRIQIQIPENAKSGRHKIAVLVSGRSFSGWLAPASPTRHVVGAPEIEVTVEGRVIQDGERSPVDFGSTVVGTPVQRKFQVTNTGSAPLILGRLKVPAGFRLLGSFPDTIVAGSSASFSVGLEAASANAFSGMLQFDNNDSDENPFDFEITGAVNPLPAPDVVDVVHPVPTPEDVGAVSAPDIIVLVDRATSVRPGQSAAIDFDTTSVGVPVERAFQVHNTGTATLRLRRLRLPPGFRLVGTFPSRIEAGGFASFVVQLEAASETTFSGSLQFDTNIADLRRLTFPIRGTVRTASPVAPSPLAEWWMIAPIVLGGGLGAVFGTRYVYKRMVAKSASKAAVSLATPLIQFNPQKDFGTQRTPESEPIRVDFELRVTPVLDLGRQKVRARQALIVGEKVTVVGRTQTTSGFDDLKRIEGIGPKISSLLQSAGIGTFAQLAASDTDELRQMLIGAGIWVADPSTWPEQSRLAAAGEWQALEELQAELKGGRVVQKER